MTEAKGRKTQVKARVEDLDGVLLVEAEYVILLLHLYKKKLTRFIGERLFNLDTPNY